MQKFALRHIQLSSWPSGFMDGSVRIEVTMNTKKLHIETRGQITGTVGAGSRCRIRWRSWSLRIQGCDSVRGCVTKWSSIMTARIIRKAIRLVLTSHQLVNEVFRVVAMGISVSTCFLNEKLFVATVRIPELEDNCMHSAIGATLNMGKRPR